MASLLVVRQLGLAFHQRLLFLPLVGGTTRTDSSDHGARHRYSWLGCNTQYNVVTTDGKFTLRGGYVSSKARLLSDASLGGWPAIWFIDTRTAAAAVRRSTCRRVDSFPGVPRCRVVLQRADCFRIDVPHTIWRPIGLQLRHTQAHERWVQYLRDGSTSPAGQSRRTSTAGWSVRGLRTSAPLPMRSSSGTLRPAPAPRVFTRQASLRVPRT